MFILPPPPSSTSRLLLTERQQHRRLGGTQWGWERPLPGLLLSSLPRALRTDPLHVIPVSDRRSTEGDFSHLLDGNVFFWACLLSAFPPYYACQRWSGQRRMRGVETTEFNCDRKLRRKEAHVWENAVHAWERVWNAPESSTPPQQAANEQSEQLRWDLRLLVQKKSTTHSTFCRNEK